MKNKLALILATASSLYAFSAYAVAPGMYMGLAAGPATNSGGTQQLQVDGSPTPTAANPRSTQFGSRLYIGYDIGQYAGIEAGLDYFSTINYKTVDNVTTCSSANVQVRDIDFLAKGRMPIKMFDIYGKAGVAVTYINESGDLSPQLDKHCGEASNLIKYRPMMSVGVSYDLSQNWVVDASWSRIQVGSAVSSIDFYALGFSYHFVDIYCGQFLCD